ncbi:MAG: hypothetical protein ACP5VE_03915 [Chthonomonadales bacterium]
MSRWVRAAIACTVFAVSALEVSAAPKHPQHKPAAAPKCPVCKMALSPKKDKMHTVAVKVGGKTYYCCAQCNMKGHAAAKGHGHAGAHHKM